jgi:hypothetical protein
MDLYEKPLPELLTAICVCNKAQIEHTLGVSATQVQSNDLWMPANLRRRTITAYEVSDFYVEYANLALNLSHVIKKSKRLLYRFCAISDGLILL